jgi:hypothetical protein
MIPKEKIFPSILIILDIAASIGYIHTGEWRKILYWLFAAGLTLMVTW